VPDPDLGAAQYELAEDVLEEGGYDHYEISNWAKAGKQCVHNLGYWQDRPYIGVGVAAHSYNGRTRWSNTAGLSKYLRYTFDKGEDIPGMREQIFPMLRRSDALILGLRFCSGVDVEDFNNIYHTDIFRLYSDQFEELSFSGLIQKDGSNLSLTRKGRLLSNEVFWRLLPGERQG
ncbi:MAG: coproporphyrinogen III oxidase family protein, partial [Dehalococcoidia bacterium]